MEEVSGQLVAVFAQHRLGMKLHPVHRGAAVRDALNDAVLAARRHDKHLGDRCRIQAERMVARGRERRGQAGENAAAVVFDVRNLAVHLARRVRDGCTEHLTDRLQSEADAENRHLTIDRGAQYRQHRRNVLRPPGTRADDQRLVVIEQLGPQTRIVV